MDIYSLGATFYTLMSGLLPDRQGGEFLPLNSMHLPYSSALVHIVEKAMEERPRKRFATAQAMHRALDYIYKMDAGYRRLQKISCSLWGGCGLLLVAGILCCTYGWKESAREDYRRDYQEFYETAQKYEDENTISIGIDILNNSRYRGILTDNPEDKAQILYMIGNIYYGLEDYASAEDISRRRPRKTVNLCITGIRLWQRQNRGIQQKQRTSWTRPGRKEWKMTRSFWQGRK